MLDNNTGDVEFTKWGSWEEAKEAMATFRYDKEKRFRKLIQKYMMKWVEIEDENHNTQVQFCREVKIRPSCLRKWAEKYPDFKEDYDLFRLILGDRALRDAERRRRDGNVVLRYLHTYSPEWDDINRYHAKLKNQEGQGTGSTNYITVKGGSEMFKELDTQEKTD